MHVIDLIATKNLPSNFVGATNVPLNSMFYFDPRIFLIFKGYATGDENHEVIGGLTPFFSGEYKGTSAKDSCFFNAEV